jgi:uncharacterized protein YicC (UPF0701 family)
LIKCASARRHLAKDLAARYDDSRRQSKQVRTLFPESRERYRARCTRDRKAGSSPAETNASLKEVAIFADRSDVSEELDAASKVTSPNSPIT